MSGIVRIDIPSHSRSQIQMHARTLVALHASGLLEGAASLQKRHDRERLGLSGEFAVAALMGRTFEFREAPDGDGGADLHNHGVAIDVKTSFARTDADRVTAYPETYRSKVIVFVRQVVRERWESFDILGWLFAEELRRMAGDRSEVDFCRCRLRSARGGLPPDGYGEARDPDVEECCDDCGWMLQT